MAEITLETILQELKNTKTELSARIEKTETTLGARIDKTDAGLSALGARIEKTETTLGARIDKIEGKEEDRFQFVKESFQDMQSEFQSFRSDVNQRFDKVDRSLELLAGQTQIHIGEIKALNRRVSKLESTNA